MLQTLHKTPNENILQCNVIFFMETGKEDAVVALLMVATWSRYVSVVPLKPRNTQTVRKALVKFLNEVDRAKKVEVAGDNEPFLAAGMRFCQSARQRLGLETVLTWNRAMKSHAPVWLNALSKLSEDFRRL